MIETRAGVARGGFCTRTAPADAQAGGREQPRASSLSSSPVTPCAQAPALPRAHTPSHPCPRHLALFSSKFLFISKTFLWRGSMCAHGLVVAMNLGWRQLGWAQCHRLLEGREDFAPFHFAFAPKIHIVTAPTGPAWLLPCALSAPCSCCQAAQEEKLLRSTLPQ